MVKTNFAFADYLIVILYFIFLFYIGFSSKLRKNKSSEDYFVAGRQVTLPAFIATIVATWYNGVLGVGEMISYYGLAAWTINALPYYLFAVIFALFLAEKVRAASIYTIPDRLSDIYGKTAGVLGGFLTFVLTNPASNILMVGTLVSALFGFPLIIAVPAGAIISSVYLYMGGLKADVRINILQFLMMFIGFAVMAVAAIYRFGGLEYLKSNIEPAKLTLKGGQSNLFILSWFFIALWTLVEPSFHQRVASTKDSKTAKLGLLGAIGGWFLFDILTMTTGLYAWAYFAKSGAAVIHPDFSPLMLFPWFASIILPAGFRGIFWVGMFAAIMAGAIGFMFVSGVAFGRDFLWRMMSGKENTELKYSRIGLFIGTVIGVVLALLLPSVVSLWFFVGSCVVPALIAPVIGAYYPKLRPSRWGANLLLIMGFLPSFISFVWGETHKVDGLSQYPFGILPLYCGLAFALIIWLVDIALKQRKNSLRVI